MPTGPFVNHDEWTIDAKQIFEEALALGTLIGLLGFIALLPLAIAIYVGIFPLGFTLLSQFLLAIASAIVLVYIIARAIQLANGE